jgi:hypothetical protein
MIQKTTHRTIAAALSAGLLALLLPGVALAAEPSPFATASASCEQGTITFPPQSSSYSDVIYHFQSLEAHGYSLPGDPQFGPGDSGWASLEPYAVEAGIAPTLGLFCSSPGSVDASLAARPSTPATFSGTTAADDDSYLPFSAPGAGQYVVELAITQGAIQIEDASGILESSGAYPLGSLAAGNHNLEVRAQSGPQAVWTATVRELPVTINKLSFSQTCMAPGTGLPATFAVTGDATITASIINSASQTVRNLGTFSVKEGESSIPWDGRGEGGSTLSSGAYTLRLVSTDPQGESTTAQAPIYVTNTGPTVSMTSPTTIEPTQSVAFQVTDPTCGVASATVTVDGEEIGTYHEGAAENPLPSNGTLVFKPHTSLKVGKYSWNVKATDKVGNVTTKSGTFSVVASTASVQAKPKGCVVERQVQRLTSFPSVIELKADRTSCRTANGVALVMKDAAKHQNRFPHKPFRLSKAYGRQRFRCTYRDLYTKHPPVDLGIEATCHGPKKAVVTMHLAS